MTAPDVSRVFDAIDSLVALWTAEFADDATIYVTDGPPTSAIATGSTVLLVAAAGDPSDVRAADSELDPSGMSNQLREVFDVHCHIEQWVGGDDVRGRREGVRSVLNRAAAAVNRDRSLNGAVTRARVMGSLALAQAHFKGDSGAAMPFTVHCDVA